MEITNSDGNGLLFRRRIGQAPRVTSPVSRAKERKAIEHDIERFIEAGGKIEVLDSKCRSPGFAMPSLRQCQKTVMLKELNKKQFLKNARKKRAWTMFIKKLHETRERRETMKRKGKTKLSRLQSARYLGVNPYRFETDTLFGIPMPPCVEVRHSSTGGPNKTRFYAIEDLDRFVEQALQLEAETQETGRTPQ